MTNEKLPEAVTLREVCPRDGLQNVTDFVATADKLRIIDAIAKAGCREMEVTSFVSGRVVPQLTDAREVMEALVGASFTRSVLVPTPARAAQAVEAGADQLVVFLSASEAHNRSNVNRSIAESLTGLRDIFELAARARVPVVGAIAASFGCPFEGDVPHERVLGICEEFRSLGCAGLIFGDTVGMATPLTVERLVKSYQDRFADNNYSLHFHNNRGAAMTNLYAAMMAGATTFDTSVGGIGGCPTVPDAAGNLATEDVVCLLHELGVQTGLDLHGLLAAAHILERVLGYTLPGQVMKSGAIETGDRASGTAPPVCGLDAGAAA